MNGEAVQLGEHNSASATTSVVTSEGVGLGAQTLQAARFTVSLTSASLVLANLQNSIPGVFVEAVVPDVAGPSFEVLLSATEPVGETADIGWFVVN